MLGLPEFFIRPAFVNIIDIKYWTKNVRDHNFQYSFFFFFFFLFEHIKLDSVFLHYGICSNYLAIIW